MLFSIRCRISSTPSIFDGSLYNYMYRFRTHYQPQKKKNKNLSTINHTAKYHNYELKVVDKFKYLRSTINSKLSFDTEIHRQIGRAANTLSCLGTRVWKTPRLTTKFKVTLYNTCVFSTLLFGIESWTTYAVQEVKVLNIFHMRLLRKLLGIFWTN